jgi:hypothetical protein
MGHNSGGNEKAKLQLKPDEADSGLVEADLGLVVGYR